MNWRDDAACLGTFNGDFFLERGQSSRRAKAICSECPVLAECLDFAITYPMPFGIFGGMTESERRKLKKRMEAA